MDTPQCSNLLEDELIEELLGILRQQERPEEDLLRTKAAFDVARRQHEGQFRKNKQNYIVHPVSVAIILAKIPVDTATVEAALLHDVIEDTPITAEELEALFGEEVVKLVTGVTKLGKFEFASKEDAHAENFRKMFLAMADDVRVIWLKLADRLHNMRTLCDMKPEKQIKTATETIEIFAPLANRMGMGKIRAELEDLSMKYLHPEEYQQIDDDIRENKENREETIGSVISRIENQLSTMGLKARIYGRVKNYFSIYKKMRSREKSVNEIHDISAVRVIVDSERECYEALGVIHHAFTPIPGRFKDYIAMPKSNLYQSLHTTVIGPSGKPLEVQIRTQHMHRTAEYGIAAHWKYKDKSINGVVNPCESSDDQQMSWLRQMAELKNDVANAKEYVDSVKLDLFRDEVFVFTPKGKVVVLPKGATTVDFAYRIHTEVGHTCTGARINGKIVPLSHELRNGDFVDILTNKKSTPRLDWLAFVQTQSAKSRIRHWFKKHYRDVHEEQGKKLLEAEFTRAVVDEALKSGKLTAIAHELNYSALEDLFVAIGYGEVPLARISNRLKREAPDAEHDALLHSVSNRQQKRLPSKDDIQGLKGMVYQNAKCCTPLPGEGIIGVVTRSRGVMVHRNDCNNLHTANPARLMQVQWEGEAKSNYSIHLEIHVIDRVGVLKDILTKIADYNTNLGNTKVNLLNDGTALVEVTLEVENLRHLDRVKDAITHVHDVISVRRQNNLKLKK